MSVCTATANPRSGVTLRCDRTAGHKGLPISDDSHTLPSWHYDLHQDADWHVDPVGVTLVNYRTVGGDR